jgi:hypothetical protein
MKSKGYRKDDFQKRRLAALAGFPFDWTIVRGSLQMEGKAQPKTCQEESPKRNAIKSIFPVTTQ